MMNKSHVQMTTSVVAIYEGLLSRSFCSEQRSGGPLVLGLLFRAGKFLGANTGNDPEVDGSGQPTHEQLNPRSLPSHVTHPPQ